MRDRVVQRVLLVMAVAVVLAVTTIRVDAQEQKPLAFEVASIKPNTSGDVRKSIGPAPGGLFLATNNTLRDLLPFAFGLPQATASFRIVGGPKWIDDDRFDVAAKVNGAWTPAQMSEMLRTLLVERFRLSAHHETRESPMFALVSATPGGTTLGPHLRRSDVDQGACDARRAAIQRREAVPPIAPGAKPVCATGRTVPGGIMAVGWSMDSLTSALSPFVDRVVADRTTLAGLYDVELTWTPDQPAPPGADASPNVDPNGPSLVTAIQEQLGLKLESTKGPVDVLVIDHVDRPTQD